MQNNMYVCKSSLTNIIIIHMYIYKFVCVYIYIKSLNLLENLAYYKTLLHIMETFKAR